MTDKQTSDKLIVANFCKLLNSVTDKVAEFKKAQHELELMKEELMEDLASFKDMSGIEQAAKRSDLASDVKWKDVVDDSEPAFDPEPDRNGRGKGLKVTVDDASIAKLYRAEKSLTLREAAESAGVARGTWARFESMDDRLHNNYRNKIVMHIRETSPFLYKRIKGAK